MAVFGRQSARQRLRRATQQALSIPAFRTPADCTPWVLGGLWPPELEVVTPETASLAEYLKTDLLRIASSANAEMRVIGDAGLTEAARRAEEARVINAARAFAAQRVESTVRLLRRDPRVQSPGGPALSVTDEPEVTHEAPETPEATEAVESGGIGDAGEVIEDVEVQPAESRLEAQPEPAGPEPATPEPGQPEPAPEPPRPPESPEHRLRRLVDYVARQEPGLRWAVGDRADGGTVLTTDLAHGWVPSGIALPSGVELLLPRRRSGNAAALLGPTELSATYRPGDTFQAAAIVGATPPSGEVRAAPPVEDLGWQLTDATHWRDGLPRMVHTMAKAGAAGTGVVDAEVDLLRVHLDTARYQLYAQYPDIDNALLCNCLLLAATEALVTGDQTAANYHFAWFLELTAAPAGLN